MPRSGSFILGIKWKSQGLKPSFFVGVCGEDNIKVYVKGTISEGVEWINLTRAINKQQSVVKTAMNLQGNGGNCVIS